MQQRLDINDTSFVYGEVVPKTFLKILDIVKPLTNEIFYDLGSDTGKAVFTAALQSQWKKCIGVEFVRGLAYISQELLKVL